MMNLKDILFFRIAAAFLISLSAITISAQETTPPPEVQYLYSKEKDQLVSDDFNEIDWTKWTLRRGMGGKDQVSIAVQGSDTVLVIRGDAEKKQGAGLSSMNSTKYGFYITRWKVAGIHPGQPVPWHPSVWGACVNFGVDAAKLIPKPAKRLELDLMECFTVPNWGIHINVWGGKPNFVTHVFKPRSTDFPIDDWSVVGMEYTPEYLAVWEFLDGKWCWLRSIPFTEGKNIRGKQINYAFRSRMYWIISNIYQSISQDWHQDSELFVDYFYYYPFNFFPNLRWD